MKSNLLLLIVFLSLANSNMAISQINMSPNGPCNSAESAQFDFWLGDWNLTYNDTVHATNNITKEMDGCLIHEHFRDPVNNYTGESWSEYNPRKKLWQQTWVDNQNGYIVLTGGFNDGKMILTTELQTMPDGTRKQNRMVFSEITSMSFNWIWQATTDDGKTWTTSWAIHYKRKGAH